jgi:16S rRNA (guanine527-N7)-methyltransferase
LDIIRKYFNHLNNETFDKVIALLPLYKEWNEKINVISRKDVDNFYERHVLHSLSIAKIFNFSKNDIVLDIGTGGGFPGIPLAILFPETEFHLIDSIGKKITVVNEISTSLNLKNVVSKNCRAEAYTINYTYVVTRAVAPAQDLLNWSGDRFKKSNGIIALKGGDLKLELAQIKNRFAIYNLNKYFEEEFFETKKIIHIYN